MDAIYPADQFNTGQDKHRHFTRLRVLVRPLQFTVDLTVLTTAFTLAYLLRFEFAIPATERSHFLVQLGPLILVQLALLDVSGVYNFIWRYIGMAELRAFLKAALYSAIPLLLLRLLLTETHQVLRLPVSIILVDTVLAFGGVLGVRVLRRDIHETWGKRHRANGKDKGPGRSILLIGAGRAGVMVAKEIQGRSDTDLQIAGFIDDAPQKQGSVIHGIKVLGTTKELPQLVRALGIDHVVVSIAQASRADFRRILDICEEIPVKVRTVPCLYEVLQGTVKVSRIRDVQIEDLLGREPVELDELEIARFVAGKVVMVTGAGGSIGLELARQVARFRPSKILLVERAEFALFSIDRQLHTSRLDLEVVPLVADVGHESRMRPIFERHRPSLVLHAAAHKHVPMMEFNAAEAIRNNVLATNLLGELAAEFNVEAFVLISTDKAVRPSSVMGATKRTAELVIQDLSNRFATRYVAVRFGNVIGSTGSVIPIFKEQIRKGGPVTVTHPDMTRYFMTIPEAAQLVLQAGAMGLGGEIFILDMGKPVRILDLAKMAITLSGLRPYSDIDIVFTGMRPGEKLYEELELTKEQTSRTRHPKIFIGKINAYPREQIRDALERLAFLSENGLELEIRRFLNDLLPEARLSIPETFSEPAAEIVDFPLARLHAIH